MRVLPTIAMMLNITAGLDILDIKHDMDDAKTKNILGRELLDIIIVRGLMDMLNIR